MKNKKKKFNKQRSYNVESGYRIMRFPSLSYFLNITSVAFPTVICLVPLLSGFTNSIWILLFSFQFILTTTNKYLQQNSHFSCFYELGRVRQKQNTEDVDELCTFLLFSFKIELEFNSLHLAYNRECKMYSFVLNITTMESQWELLFH